MKKLIVIIIAIATVCSCHNASNKSLSKYRSYTDAENEFVGALTQLDTATVIFLANSFVDALKEGNISGALEMLYCLDGNVLYKISDNFSNELVSRFESFPVGEFSIDHYSFSTAGSNDLCYQYTVANTEGNEHPMQMKLMFNPVKVDNLWYLTLKDGNQSSKDLDEKNQTHPYSLAPADIVLNKNN